MDRCPTCAVRYRGGEVCHRCGTQLGRVLALEAEGCRKVAAAREALRRGDGATARQLAQRACVVHQTPEALRALALAALLEGQYRQAVSAWTKAVTGQVTDARSGLRSAVPSTV